MMPSRSPAPRRGHLALGRRDAARVHPNLCEENGLFSAGYARVAGVDEAGRGPWAGPVCAAAVMLPLAERDLSSRLFGLRDSKLLSPSRRESLLPRIVAVADSVGVGWALPSEVDSVGIVVGAPCSEQG